MESECSSSNGGPGRSRLYKLNGRDQVALRDKRRAEEVEIRKNKRTDRFQRNRQIPKTNENQELTLPTTLSSVIEQLQSMQVIQVEEAVQSVYDNVGNGSWSIQILAKADIFHKLAEVMCNRPLSAELRLKISHLFLKISGLNNDDYSRNTTDECCVQAIVFNLSNYGSEEEIICDSIQAMACFICRSIIYRNLALDAAIVPELLNLCSLDASDRLKRFLMYITTLICEKLNKYSPEVEEIVPLLDIVGYGIQSSDSMVQTDATAACVNLSEWPEIYEYMKESHVCSMLVANLRNNSGNARPTVQWGISMIIQATSFFTEEMINAGLLDVLKGFVNVNFMAQEVCFLISNICVEGEFNIEKLIDSGVLQCVARVMEISEYRARREAAFVFCHCCESTNQKHLTKILEMGVLGGFCDMLTVMDANLVSFVLDALQSLLNYGDCNLTAPDYTNQVAVKLEELGGRKKLEFLCESQCIDIHCKAYSLLQRYYDNQNEESSHIIETLPRSTIDDSIETVLMVAP